MSIVSSSTDIDIINEYGHPSPDVRPNQTESRGESFTRRKITSSHLMTITM